MQKVKDDAILGKQTKQGTTADSFLDMADLKPINKITISDMRKAYSMGAVLVKNRTECFLPMPE